MEHTQTVYNTDEESCFIVTASASDMESYHSDLIQSEFLDSDSLDASSNATEPIQFGPLIDVLKLPKGTALNILSNDDWAPSDLATFTTRTVTNEFMYDNSTEEEDVDIRKWSRSFMVDLLPGALEGEVGEESVDDVVASIVEYVKDMAQVSPNAGSRASSSSYLRSNGDTSRMAVESFISTREAFSLTATSSGDENEESGNVWSDALANGFEAPHGCQVMLDTLEVRTRKNKDVNNVTSSGFEVLMHPPSQFMKQAAVESSAWNKDCALSLLMGLAVHPSVQTVEVSHTIELASVDVRVVGARGRRREALDLDGIQAKRIPKTTGDSLPEPERESASNDSAFLLDSVEPDLVAHGDSNDLSLTRPANGSNGSRRKGGATNPQWITQSGVVDSRPFFDDGLDGTGQVVAVADGGLDQDNCYFRDASSNKNIYGSNGWDFAQRKIVHYDDSFGDRVEKKQGHGTYVSSIIAGKKSSDGRTYEEVGQADGTAPGSSLAFFDMADGYASIADPGADRLLKSLYNPENADGDDNKGARVINASWGRSYSGQYTGDEVSPPLCIGLWDRHLLL